MFLIPVSAASVRSHRRLSVSGAAKLALHSAATLVVFLSNSLAPAQALSDEMILTADSAATSAEAAAISTGLALQPPALASLSRGIAPYMLRLESGNLLLAYTAFTGPGGSGEPHVIESADGGQSWSASVKAVASPGSHLQACGMVELHNGAILMAYHDGHLNGGDPVPPPASRIRIARRPANGTTWEELSTVHQSSLVGVWEGALTLLPDGKLLCHLASEELRPDYPNAIFQSESTDGGLTWSAARRIIGMAGSRDGVPSVVRLPSGRLLCFFEAQDWWNIGTIPTDFFILYVYSDDNGATWSTERRVASVPTSSELYHRHTAPAVALLPNGKIIVTFYSSDGYPTRPVDRYTDMAYVESDAPYTSWTLARRLIGEPLEADRWGSIVFLDNTNLGFAYTRDVGGSGIQTEFYKGIYSAGLADNFEGRIALSGNSGHCTGSTSDATRETGEPVHAGLAGGKSAWWSFTPAFSGIFHLNTTGSNFDTVLAMYTGSAVGSLQPYFSNDNAGPGTLTSSITVPVTAGVGYKIAVDGAQGVSGFVTLGWSLCQTDPQSPALASPTDGAVLDRIPAAFDWSDVPDALYFDVILDGVVVDQVTTSFWNLVTPMDTGSHTWQIRARNECGWSLSPLRSFTAHDLRMVSADFSPATPATLAPGQPLNCSWSIDGPSTEGSGVWFELFASRSGGFDVERFGGTVTNSFASAHAGGLATYTPGNQILTNIPDGIYTLVASVNRTGTGGRSETNPYNNYTPVAGKRLFVHNPTSPTSDLTWQTPPAIQVNYQWVSISGDVINQGATPSPAYGFWVETVYGVLTPEGTFAIHGYLGSGSKVNSSLAPGETYFYSRAGKLPPGAWAIAVIVDSTDLAPEADETNNYSVSRTPPAFPGTVDLQIVSADIQAAQKAPSELQPGAALQWSCTVRNSSAADSGPVWFELFASQTGGLDTVRAGTTLTASEPRNVPAGQTVTFHFTQSVNAISDGIYTPVAMVNRRGLGGPDDPTPADNRRLISGRVLLHNTASAGANLVWQTEPALTHSGEQMTVTGTVRNAGTQPSGPFWTELFEGTFNENGLFLREGAVGGGIYNPGLAPGAEWTYTKTQNHTLKGKSLGVLTDSTDIVPEADETDNYRYF